MMLEYMIPGENGCCVLFGIPTAKDREGKGGSIERSMILYIQNMLSVVLTDLRAMME